MRHVAAEAVVLEGSISGRHIGDFQGIAPKQRTFEVPLCAVFTFDGAGKLAAERVHFDATVLLKQLGVLG